MSPKECVELVEYMTRKCPMLHFAGVSAATQLGRDPEVRCVCVCVCVCLCVCVLHFVGVSAVTQLGRDSEVQMINT